MTSLYSRLSNALDPEGCVIPYSSSKSDLRFQRALGVPEHHSNRTRHELSPDRSPPQGQVALAIQDSPGSASRSPFAFAHLSRDHRASYAPACTESPTPRTQRGWHRERAAAGRGWQRRAPQPWLRGVGKTCSSCSQHPQDHAKPYVTSVPGYRMPSSGFSEH